MVAEFRFQLFDHCHLVGQWIYTDAGIHPFDLNFAESDFDSSYWLVPAIRSPVGQVETIAPLLPTQRYVSGGKVIGLIIPLDQPLPGLGRASIAVR